jgi:hypothetical protein
VVNVRGRSYRMRAHQDVTEGQKRPMRTSPQKNDALRRPRTPRTCAPSATDLAQMKFLVAYHAHRRMPVVSQSRSRVQT